MNADSGSLVCIAVILAVSFIVFVSLVSNSLNRGALDEVAKRWNGRVEPGGIFGYDEIVMQIGDAFARLSYSKRGKNGRNTHLSIYFPDKELRLELYVQDLLQQLKKLLGMEDIEIGSPAFDDAFVINGNHPGLIREYLTPNAQSAIQQLARFSTLVSPDLHLTIGGGVLRVTKHRGYHSVHDLQEFILLFEAVFEQLAYARSKGIEFLPSTPLPLVQETQCQVCGQPLTGKIVFCAKCKTPHHLDCWQYFEQCAVYGCGQSRYVEPRQSA